MRALASVLIFAVLLIAAPTLGQSTDPPIVFVHGNGDTAALWHTTIWRFESNGYARDRLFAIDLKFPSARSVDAKPQEGRSSTDEVMAQLAAFVDETLAKTGARKVALVGNSRGANTIRNYLRFGGGARPITHIYRSPFPARLGRDAPAAGDPREGRRGRWRGGRHDTSARLLRSRP